MSALSLVPGGSRLLSQGLCCNLVGEAEVCNLVEGVCGDGYSNPLHYSCLENPMGRGDWWATVHGVPQSQRWLKQLSMHACEGCVIGKNKSDSILDLFLWLEPCIPLLLLQMNTAWNKQDSPFSRLWPLKVKHFPILVQTESCSAENNICLVVVYRNIMTWPTRRAENKEFWHQDVCNNQPSPSLTLPLKVLCWNLSRSSGSRGCDPAVLLACCCCS